MKISTLTDRRINTSDRRINTSDRRINTSSKFPSGTLNIAHSINKKFKEYNAKAGKTSEMFN